jgi:hypothetical protein
MIKLNKKSHDALEKIRDVEECSFLAGDRTGHYYPLEPFPDFPDVQKRNDLQ